MGGCFILDTETTGLDSNAEIVEISIIDDGGNVFLNTLIKPTRPIPPDATAIHGITNEMVEDALSFCHVYDSIIDILVGAPVVIYNASYDLRMIRQSAVLSGVMRPVAADLRSIESKACCLMNLYAEYYGEWDSYRHQYKWQKLTNALAQQGIVPSKNAHRAMADCQMTLALLEKMAGEL